MSRQLTVAKRLGAGFGLILSLMAQLFAEQGATDQERSLLKAIEGIEREALAKTETLLTMNNQMASQKYLLDEVSGAYSEWLVRVNVFIDHEEAKAAAGIAEVRQTAGGFSMLSLTVTGMAIVLGALVAGLIIRGLRRTLGAEPEDVAHAIRELANGVLNTNIRTDYPNTRTV